MGLFKKTGSKGIHSGTWGCLFADHKIDVDTIANELRCVEREGTLNGGRKVTFLRVFLRKEAESKGVKVTGWETFDQHPDLIVFEGYLGLDNKAHLEEKRAWRK